MCRLCHPKSGQYQCIELHRTVMKQLADCGFHVGGIVFENGAQSGITHLDARPVRNWENWRSTFLSLKRQVFAQDIYGTFMAHDCTYMVCCNASHAYIQG
jgi:hypothetical protein